MFSIASFLWPAQDVQGICLTQNAASAGNLILNGTYSIPTTPTINFVSVGFIPTLSFTSLNDLTAATFTITGVQNNTVVTDSVTGPNNTTVYSTQAFDIISSVSVDMPVTGISVGTGLIGYLPFFTVAPAGSSAFALSSTFSPYALGFNTQSINGVTYSIYQSLANLSGNGQSYATLINNSSLIQKGSPHVDTTQIIQFTDVCYNVMISVTATNNASILQAQFLQL